MSRDDPFLSKYYALVDSGGISYLKPLLEEWVAVKSRIEAKPYDLPLHGDYLEMVKQNIAIVTADIHDLERKEKHD